jgi:hypothetical protein
MPYKDPKKQKEFQRLWIAARRALFFQDKHCRKHAEDGVLVMTNLQLDHEDPKKKWSHRIWSYSWEKIMKEVAKCQILCDECHFNKTQEDGSKVDNRGYSK